MNQCKKLKIFIVLKKITNKFIIVIIENGIKNKFKE